MLKIRVQILWTEHQLVFEKEIIQVYVHNSVKITQDAMDI